MASYFQEIYLDQYIRQKLNLLEAINFYHDGGSTNTQEALMQVRTIVLSASRGSRQGVGTSVIVLSDGMSNVMPENTPIEADRLKSMGARIYAVMVGDEFNQDEINKISTNSSYVYRLEKEDQVESVARSILNQNCLPWAAFFSSTNSELRLFCHLFFF